MVGIRADRETLHRELRVVLTIASKSFSYISFSSSESQFIVLFHAAEIQINEATFVRPPRGREDNALPVVFVVVAIIPIVMIVVVPVVVITIRIAVQAHEAPVLDGIVAEERNVVGQRNKNIAVGQ